MLRSGVLALALAVSGCSYHHAGKAVVGGTVLSLGGAAFAINGSNEEGTKTAVEISLGVTVVGLILVAVGVLELAAGPPPPEPVDRRPPSVAGTDGLRSQTRVAQHLAARGRCDQVQQIAARVVAADRTYYERTFLRDAAIAKCTAAVMARPGSPPR